MGLRQGKKFLQDTYTTLVCVLVKYCVWVLENVLYCTVWSCSERAAWSDVTGTDLREFSRVWMQNFVLYYKIGRPSLTQFCVFWILSVCFVYARAEFYEVTCHVVASHVMWLRYMSCGCVSYHVVASHVMWLRLMSCGCVSCHVVASHVMWLCHMSCGYVSPGWWSVQDRNMIDTNHVYEYCKRGLG
jgi:hypothetical protein